MVMAVMPYSSANSSSSVVRIMVPSSRMISQQRPASLRPAMRMRSTVASVWPERTSTPPSFARSGNMCPGLRNSWGWMPSSTVFSAVMDRSTAEMPVVVLMWSMETVNAVSWLSVLAVTIWVSPRSSQRLPLMGMQMRPFAWTAMKLMFSVVANSAAQMRSPSFSRSGSSTQRMSFPAFRSSTACSMVANSLAISFPSFYEECSPEWLRKTLRIRILLKMLR